MPHPSGRPWIVAHRGSTSAAQENTVEAFREAQRLGADAVELDVRRTADGMVVVHHDAGLRPNGPAIVELTRDEVREAAPQVPDLEAALAACDDLWVDIEVKNNPLDPDWDPDDRALHATVEVVDRLGVADRILISSFNLPTVDRARRAGLRTGWLLPHRIDPRGAVGRWPGHPWVLPALRTMGRDDAMPVVQAYSAIAVEVGVWTVNDGDDMLRLARAGVGAIFTDDVPAAVATLL
jgi:glycerophosphoryl diester phosphodiesterase